MTYNRDRIRPRWRRKELAEYWRVSARTVDRMVADGRLGPPKYIRCTPVWTDEQREAAEMESRIKC